jgi:hypothetical protein
MESRTAECDVVILTLGDPAFLFQGSAQQTEGRRIDVAHIVEYADTSIQLFDHYERSDHDEKQNDFVLLHHFTARQR